MKKKIMVIDDNETILKDVTKRLTDFGYDVIARSQALGSSRVILSEEPDLIILDLVMPSLSGEDILKALTENMTDLPPILIFSEVTPEELERISKQTTIKHFLRKSQRHLLLEKVKELLRG